MAKLGTDYRNQSLSHGTHITDDIFDAVKGFLPDHLITLYDNEKDESVKSEILNDDVFEHLNEIAPDGYYFGAHPGDGSDFGFWEYKDIV